MWRCGLYNGALHVLKYCTAVCPPVSSFLFGNGITLLGEEGAGMCASRAFVCLFCASEFLSFFSSSWCRVWLRFVIVAVPGLFY